MLRFAQMVIALSLLFSVNLYANAIGEVSGTFEEAPCMFQEPGGVEIDCGYLTVPENYEDPEGSQIRLAVAILRHPDGNPEPDPIIYLEGGPGGSPLELLFLTYGTIFEPMFAANRDIILFDQRGVGLSEPALDCDEYNGAYLDLLDYEFEGEELTDEEFFALDLENFLACGETLSAEVDLTQYNSANNAADVEALRTALNYEQVNLWGISYGTRLGLTIMRDYPQSIRSVILDSLTPIEGEFIQEVPNSYNRSLDILFADCAADLACAEAFPDLEDVYYSTIEALNENPARIDASNPLTGESFENIRFNGDNFSLTIFQLLYDSSFLRIAPQFIYEIADGVYDNLEIVFGSLLLSQSAISTGMNFAVNCYEELPFIDLEAMEANYLTWPGYDADDAALQVSLLVESCPVFQPGSAPALENEPVVSDLPTLVVSGEYDPVTPPAFAEQVADVLPNDTYIEFPASGHGPTGSVECAQQIAVDFFIDPTAELDTACVETLTVDFITPGAADTEIAFVPLDLTEYNINATTIIPESWDSVAAPGGLAVFTRGESALDQTAVTFIPLPGVSSIQQVTAVLSAQFSLDTNEEMVIETEAYSWSIFPVEVQGFPGSLAITLDAGGAIVVLFLSDEETRDAVLIPMLEAFTPAE